MRLGLRISANAIGWFLYSSHVGEINGVVDGGVRVFSDGRDPKTRVPLGAARREARRRRRRRDRYLRRRTALAKLLTDAGMFPPNMSDRKLLENLDPYELRARALDNPLPLDHFARALLHINQRRGFLSLNLSGEISNETGLVKSASANLDRQMEASKARTYGEFHHMRQKNAQFSDEAPSSRVRRSVRSDGALGYFEFFPERHHLAREFQVLWAKQSKFHPSKLTVELQRSIEEVIFFQRPLKRSMPGQCRVSSERQLSRAHPLTQKMHLLDSLNSLRIRSPGKKLRRLSREQRDAAILAIETERLAKKKLKVSFYSIGKAIEICDGEALVPTQGAGKSVYLDTVNSSMSATSLFGDRWKKMTCAAQCNVIERIQSVDAEEDFNVTLKWLVDKHSLCEAAAKQVLWAKLPVGFSSFGKTATQKILVAMEQSVKSTNEVVTKLFDHYATDKNEYQQSNLQYYGRALPSITVSGTHKDQDDEITRFGRIPNPTMHIVLNQLRRLINQITEEFGRPEEMFLEIAKDIRWTENKKKSVAASTKKRAQSISDFGERLEESGFENNGKNRLLLRLWEELKDNEGNARCPYSRQLINVNMVFDGTCSVSHILPYSRTLDDGYANRLLCIAGFAQQKGSKTPWEAWSGTDLWPNIMKGIAALPPAKRWRFASDAIQERTGSSSLPHLILSADGLSARIIRDYLSTLYSSNNEGDPVYVSTGQLTELLRRRWGLNSIEKLENSSALAALNLINHDYRNHAIAAAVVGATDPHLLSQVISKATQNEQKGLDLPPKDILPPWKGFRDDVASHVQSVVVSHRCDHGFAGMGRKRSPKDPTSGKLHGDTAYGLKDGGFVVHRKPLLSLTSRDVSLTSRGANIWDSYLRGLLAEVIAGKKGKELRGALAEFSNSKNLISGIPNPYFGIRRVRLKEQKTVVPLHDYDGKPYKGISSGSNHSYEIWALPDGTVTTFVVSVFAANQPREAKPHPAAKRLQQFHKGDLVELQDSKFGPVVARVEKFDDSGTIELVPHNEANASERYRRYGEDVFIRLRLNSLIQYQARRIFVNEIGKVTGRSRGWPG